MTHPACLPVEQLLADCKVTRTRRSGPGGQHRNKVETAIVIEHLPTGTRGEASERRSQQQNHQQAIQRLRILLALNERCLTSVNVSDAWSRRVVGGRFSVNPQHEEYPALLAEALDRLHAEEYDARQASERLGISTTQLVKFLKSQPEALRQLNERRESLGLGPLR